MSYIPIGVVAPMSVEFKQADHLQSERLLIRRSGVGAANAATATHALINQGCNLVISWGFCGALGSLEVGDIVRAGTVIDASTKEIFTSSMTWPDTVISTNYVADPQKKITLATSGAVAVDMESASIARTCMTNEVAFAVLRVVVDNAHANWPSRVEPFVNGTPPEKILFATCHPLELFSALKSVYKAKVALRHLSGELEAIELSELNLEA